VTTSCPLIPPMYGRKLSALADPGTGLIIAIARHALGFLTANLVGRTLVGWGEGCSTACRLCGRSTKP
jgi:hypothetical protein